MPAYAVRPEDLAAAADLTSGHAQTLAAAARMVAAAGHQVGDGVGAGFVALAAAVGAYVQVETTIAAALAEATRVLATGMAGASLQYAAADSSVRAAMSRGKAP